MPIKFLDMFAGIGGFRSGLMAASGFACVGYCEIDRYAKQAYEAMYDTKGELYFADARTIDPNALPDLDLICGGFPCQSFSIAGLRRGFRDDARGTLFFEIARIAAVKRPPFLLLENVPGLLSHDGGRTFAAILGTLDELGYDVAWQVLNSKDFGVPQNRKRVYLIGYLRERCAGEILSFRAADDAPAEANGLLNPQQPDAALPIKVNTRAGFQLAHPGDSIDFAFPTTNTRRGRVGRQIAHTVTHGNTQACFFIDLNTAPKLTGATRCITTRQDGGIGHHKGERSGVWVEETDDGKFGVPVQTRDGETHYGRVRRLTPRECWRLQGFTDEQFNLAAATGLSDARLYKMAGNAVSVPVIAALGRFIKKIHTVEQKTQEVIASRHP